MAKTTPKTRGEFYVVRTSRGCCEIRERTEHGSGYVAVVDDYETAVLFAAAPKMAEELQLAATAFHLAAIGARSDEWRGGWMKLEAGARAALSAARGEEGA